MCGITISNNKSLINNDAIKYRGSDDFKEINHEGFSFLFSRLTIIGLSEDCMQPFENDKFFVLCNGEIYNYKKLAIKYNIPEPASDTLIVFDLLCLGISPKVIFEEIIGMYAIVIFQKSNKHTHVVRDHYGQKPLWKYKKGDSFSLSSDPKSFKDLKINKTNFEHYCSCPINGFNLFEYVEYLDPGNYFQFDEFGNEINKEKIIKNSSIDLKKIDLSHINTLFEGILNSDFTVKLLLSGGIDSTLVGSVLSRSSNKLSAITYRTKESPVESEEVKQICNELKINLQIDEVKSVEFNRLETVLEKMTIPTWDSSVIISDILLEKASRSTKVLITGDGGDENFLGYNRHRLYNLRRITSIFFNNYNGNNRILSILFGSKEKFIIASYLGFFNHLNITDNIFSNFHQDFHKLDDSFILGYMDKKFFLQNLVRRLDVLGLHHNVEVRSPLLNVFIDNHTVKDFRLLFNNKPILRSFVKKLNLNHLMSSKKRGFEFRDDILYKKIHTKLINENPLEFSNLDNINVSKKSDRNYLLHCYSSTKFYLKYK
jgi:asparagine synthetase B (glutamine-hydrolysing)